MLWFRFDEENGRVKIVDFDTISLESCSYPLKNREYIRDYCEELLNGVWHGSGKQHYSYGSQMRKYGYEMYVLSSKLFERLVKPKIDVKDSDSYTLRHNFTTSLLSLLFNPNENYNIVVDQLEEIIMNMEENPYERCFLICFWDPFLDTTMLRAQPCLNLLQFMINSETNKLEVACYMRSHDFAQAHLVNYYGISAIARYVEYRLKKDQPKKFSKLELGELLWIIYSCHIYV